MEFYRDLSNELKQFPRRAAKLGIAAVTLAMSLHASLPSSVEASGPITGGFYTNISGMEAGTYGVGAGSYNGEADCDPILGRCIARDRQGNFYLGGRVEKYVCKTTELNPLTQCDGDHNAQLLVQGPDYSMVGYINDQTYNSSYMRADHVIELVVKDGKGEVKGYMVYDTGIGDEAAFVCNGVMARSALEARLTSINYNGPWTINSETAAYNRAACGDSLAKAINPDSLSPDQSKLKVTEICTDDTITSLNVEGESHATDNDVWYEVVNLVTGQRIVFGYEKLGREGKPTMPARITASLPGKLHSIRGISSMDMNIGTAYDVKVFQAPETDSVPSDENVIDVASVVRCGM